MNLASPTRRTGPIWRLSQSERTLIDNCLSVIDRRSIRSKDIKDSLYSIRRVLDGLPVERKRTGKASVFPLRASA